MGKTSEKGKKLISGPILACWAQTWAPKFFSWVLTWMLGIIVASYHPVRFQGKLMIQTEGNGKKLHL